MTSDIHYINYAGPQSRESPILQAGREKHPTTNSRTCSILQKDGPCAMDMRSEQANSHDKEVDKEVCKPNTAGG